MPLSADDRIILVRIKIERAKDNFRYLQEILDSTRDQYFDLSFADENPQSGEIFMRAGRLPVYDFSVLAVAGDVIHNLRSTLDHLAYALVIAGTDHEPTDGVGFPIAKDKATYESIKARKVQGIRPEAVELIDSLKPYDGGNATLWKIHQLNIIDKHRSVLTIGDNAVYVVPGNANQRFLLKPRGLKAKSPSFSSAFDENMDDDVNLPSAKSFFDQQGIERQALIPTLSEFIAYVESLVPRFKPFLG